MPIYQVHRYEDDAKRVVVIKAGVNTPERLVFIEGAADLSALGVGQPVPFSVPLRGVENVPGVTADVDDMAVSAFRLYDDRAQETVEALFAEYKAFKETVEARAKLEAVQKSASKILGAPT